MSISLFRGVRGVAAGLASLSLLLASSCSRPAGMGGEDNVAHAEQRQAPFDDHQQAGASGSVNQPPAQADPKSEFGLPFRDGQSLPAGTLITVRLQNPLTADNPDATGKFDAVVDASVVIEGNTMVPRGAGVVGRVESARASKVKRNQGYVRLTLDSLSIAGRSLPVQTSSLFARGNAGDLQDSNSDASISAVHLEKGRRLTFRLTEPVLLASQQAIPVR